ncbi:MAG: glycosyltransferase [Betaproteobacteria bacterium]|nr:glycosyltransferase [Betaproteobacteria bacterium]MDH4322591.1 glycosyltransferase [Betaproteobacteria bacterium]MDH5576842.1 glycosyltransferase [Betaproteobacteria bacterium]
MSWRADTRTSVLVFARAARPGRAKTRLIPLLGALGAARLHARLVERALVTARAARLGEVMLWSSRRQRGADLGARMRHAVAHALRRAPRVILMGADAPALRPAQLRRAARWLAGGADAVFAPAEDGGYALVALRRVSPRLFQDIEWGGPRVMAQTRARLAALGWRWRELPEVWDVDRPEDVTRLRGLRL